MRDIITPLNKEELLQIVDRGIQHLKGERRKSAELLAEAIQARLEISIDINQVIAKVENSKNHPDQKKDAIKMITTLHAKMTAKQEIEEILAEEEIEAIKRAQEESQFEELSLKERANQVEFSDDPVLNLELHKISKEIGATMGRKRPCNPNKWLQLKRWERERGGAKIGEIGPMPDELSREMKQLIKEREQDSSGFTDVENLNWDDL